MSIPAEIPTIEEWVDTADQPWERMPNETDRQWAAFVAFREAGAARTQTLAAEQVGADLGTVGGWSRNNLWGVRVARYDAWLDDVYRRELAEQTRNMAKRHTELAQQTLEVLAKPLRHLLEKDPEELYDELSAKDILQLFNIAQQSARTLPQIMGAERLSVGLPTEVTQTNVQGHVDTSPDRLAAVLEAAGPDLLAALMGAGATSEIVDAEVVEVYTDPTPPETDDLPASSTT
jgi:hypothetical protein